MTFCHTEQRENGESYYAMNYMHWDHMERMLETRVISDSISENIRKCYRRLYNAENLLGKFAESFGGEPGQSRLKMALEYCGYYPEQQREFKKGISSV